MASGRPARIRELELLCRLNAHVRLLFLLSSCFRRSPVSHSDSTVQRYTHQLSIRDRALSASISSYKFEAGPWNFCACWQCHVSPLNRTSRTSSFSTAVPTAVLIKSSPCHHTGRRHFTHGNAGLVRPKHYTETLEVRKQSTIRRERRGCWLP
ncbi:hypothetical protein BDV98DRAFT_272184 [Pterulicium gracile]|uniref:Uncharacterized protein n=1 Tax=Pterulicium gracile TaxID=1884261 RepID=A0A5C3QFP0_9AGAR|nr:hypothetical protein BDV98DRAFT_272184 [Pterula gracilis]